MIDRFDLPMIMAWLLLLALGTVMISSAVAVATDASVMKHGLFLIVAALAFAFCLIVPLSLWFSGYRAAWLGAVAICALVLVPGIGHEVNGASRWISLGGFTLQSAEIAKFLLLVYLAGYLARFSSRLADEPVVLFRPLLMFAVVAALLLRQPDFGSVVVIGGMASGMLFIAGTRLRHFLVVIAAAGALLGAIALLEPYRLTRLITFTDPWAYAFNSGYQLTQALIAFGRGEFFGLGLGEGIQKLHYLPEAHNDFIFAVIAEELGLLGTLGLLVLMAFLILRILQTARQALEAERPFAGFLVYGVAFVLGLQILINLGVNTGLLPTKGLTLPFVSYGGNSLIVCSAMFGLVCRVRLELSRG